MTRNRKLTNKIHTEVIPVKSICHKASTVIHNIGQNTRKIQDVNIKLCPDGNVNNEFFCNTIIKQLQISISTSGLRCKGLRYWPISLMPCDYIWLQREKRYMKKKKMKKRRKRGCEHFLLLIPLSCLLCVLEPERKISPIRTGSRQERSPSPQIINTRRWSFLNFIVAEEATPRFASAEDQTPPLISSTPSSVLMEIRACLPATLSAQMQS